MTTYKEFLENKAELVAALEAAFLAGLDEIDHPIQQLDWFCTNADKYIKNEENSKE